MDNDFNQTEALKIFVESITHYFLQTTREVATIRTAYLGEELMPRFDFTGLITLSGSMQGCVYFSAGKPLMRDLLVLSGEFDVSEDNLLDAVGEIANTVAGNARKFYGKALTISVPIKILGNTEQIRANVKMRPFIVSLKWRTHEAVMVVDIEPTS